jgi:hypothetical protein
MNKLKLISFSLFGDEDIYLYGAISNAKIAKEIYPTYKPRFYIDSKVRRSVVLDLKKLGAEIKIKFAKIGWLKEKKRRLLLIESK